MLGAVNVLMYVLAARLILLVAVVGAFVLAYLEVGAADPWRLGVLLIYVSLVCCPLVYLAARQ